MSYRPDWWLQEKGQLVGIFDMCQMLHGDFTGSYLDMTSSERSDILKSLRWVLKNWRHSSCIADSSALYDIAVLNLIHCTLAERCEE